MVIREHLRVRRTEFGTRTLRLFRNEITEGHDLNAVGELGQIRHMFIVGNVSASDDADLKLSVFHIDPFSLSELIRTVYTRRDGALSWFLL